MTSTLDRTDLPAPGFRRPTWQEAVAGYAPRRWRTHAERHADQLPLLLILLTLALFTLRLRNGAFIDEALYINAGQDILHGWRTGAPIPDHASGFSGYPAAYPVFIALVDARGGLWLARFTSLLMVVATTVLLARTTEHLFGYRAGVLAAAAFAATGPVMFLGALATFDALTLLLLITALWLGITGTTRRSAVLAGSLLAGAVVVKYTAAAFLPAVLIAIALAGARGWSRGVLAGVTAGGLLATAYVTLADDAVRQGIAFTTTAREAMSPTSTSFLVTSLLLDIGPIIALGVLGLVVLVAQREGPLLGVVLLGAAALLPAAGLLLGEGVSFSKHTAYSAAFLAPVAGAGLAWLSRRTFAFGPVALILLLTLTVGALRAGALHREWVDVTPVVAMIEADPKPGVYISSATDVLKYYTRRADLDIAWQTTFELYARGEDVIRDAVDVGRYQMVILRSASTTNPAQDAGQELFLDALRSSDTYRAETPFAVREYSNDRWLLFHRLPAVPGAE